MTKVLNITQRDIDRGYALCDAGAGPSSKCAVTLAAIRLFKDKGITTAGGKVYGSSGRGLIKINSEVQCYQDRFDYGIHNAQLRASVKPKKIKLTLVGEPQSP